MRLVRVPGQPLDSLMDHTNRRRGCSCVRPRLSVSPWARLLLATLVLPLIMYPAASVLSAESHAGTGRVVAVDEARGTVTLNHGPIPGLMGAMQMQFPVQSVELLRHLRVGDVVRFSLEPRGEEWAIHAIESTQERPARQFAAFQAPDFTASTLSRTQIQLSGLRGKVILLNFWATWCGPCRTEMPSIDTLYRKYKDRGLEVLAVNLDTLSTAVVEEFVKEVTVTFPIVLDPGWSTARTYRVIGLPTTYLIDRGGNVVVREVGARDWAADVSETAVQDLLQ